MKIKEFRQLNLSFLLRILALLAILMQSCRPDTDHLIPITSGNDYVVYLPFLKNGDETTPNEPKDVPTIHIPYLNDTDIPADSLPEMAVFWFGKVKVNDNYIDVRIAYNDEALFIYTASFDRLLWYDNTPADMDLDEWDAISLYIMPSNESQLVPNQTFRFDGGLAPYEAVRIDYQKSYKYNGSTWVPENIPFSTVSGWRGPALNDPNDDRGWNLSFKIPYTSIGQNQKPQIGTIWQLGIVSYDRDYQTSTNITPAIWPLEFDNLNNLSWGKISFGLLQTKDPVATVQGTLIVREGLNGYLVPDASPGGYTICGDRLNFWTEWGEKVYTPTENYTANIQNQRDIADWPCYSKYFVKFPIPELPQGNSLINAKLKLHLYGNAGDWGDPVFQPYRSLIQAGVTDSNWSENTLNWNNAPILKENLSQTWVYPEQFFPGWPGVPYEWDITHAVNNAIAQGEDSVSIVLYSADGAYHSGKYFSTSEVEEWNAVARPTMILDYGIH